MQIGPKTATLPQQIAKLLFAAFLVITSLYSLLAFIPYTYWFLVKEPPFEWMAWFVRHHSFLSCIAPLCAIFGWWRSRRNHVVLSALLLQTAVTIFLAARHFLAHIQNNPVAYAVSLIVLLPGLMLMSSAAIPRESDDSPNIFTRPALFSYSNAAIVAACVALPALIATVLNHNSIAPANLGPASLLSRLELAALVCLSYAWFAVLITSLINIFVVVLAKISPLHAASRTLALTALTFIGLAIAISRFLQNSLSFHGALAYIYAIILSSFLTLIGLLVASVIFATHSPVARSRRIILLFIALVFAACSIMLPAWIGGSDWNDFLQASFNLLLWSYFSLLVFRLRSRPSNYSAASVIATLLISGSVYWITTGTAFLWARQLGASDDEINSALTRYASHDVSFNLVNQLVRTQPSEPCDEFCGNLRQYTNIRDFTFKRDLELVPRLEPSQQPRPNIFIFVLDSVRPDYLGAYNPRVDFTPNLDSFAADSFVFRNTYTQYAGTSLSEPAIWSGAMLLHAHYPRPFTRVNSLQRMLKIDGYATIVSFDPILRQILDDNSNLIKLDTDKPWNGIEISDTLRQLQSVLNGRDSRPVFFYTQPMNVHQFARNKLAGLNSTTWNRPGFNSRISLALHQTDESLGQFFHYLKSHNLYDNSIIVVTADHGDATGELGRNSHSTILFPEIMRVPLIIHLPSDMRQRVVYDEASVHALTDITPTLYYLLGHRPLNSNPVLGRSLFADTRPELPASRTSLFLASDVRAAYGFVDENGKYFYATYDSPSQSFLYDLSKDPDALHNIINETANRTYHARVMDQLQSIADFYGYKPNGSIH